MSDKTIKLMTNVPLTVKCTKYDKPREWVNQSKKDGGTYKTYSVTVEVDGREGYINLYESEYEVLKKYEPLKDKTLIFLKHEVGGNKKEFSVSTPSETGLQKGIEMATQAKQEAKQEFGDATQMAEDDRQESQVQELKATLLLEKIDNMKVIIGQLKEYKELLGDNFSTVCNTVYMSLGK